MAHYLVEARPTGSLSELRRELDAGDVHMLRPFGPSLDMSLRNARVKPDGTAVWEELDYCSPPLAEERAAVLDRFFDAITTETVEEGEGWRRIQGYPSLWDTRGDTSR